jgi:adenosylmethionine-8-amino-7-oxononanoate aminotransferase
VERVAKSTGALTNLRSVGFMAAADIVDPSTGQPFQKSARMGFRLGRAAALNGALLRPLGDSVYFMPPLNTEDAVLDALAEITEKSLKAILATSK